MKKSYFWILALVVLAIAGALIFIESETTKSESLVQAPHVVSDSELEKMDNSQLNNIAALENEKSPLALYRVAFNQSENGGVAEAQKTLKQLIDKYPDNYLAPKACIMLSDLYSRNDAVSSEIEILKILVTKYGNPADIIPGYYRLAKIYKKTKKIDCYYMTLDSIEIIAKKAEDKIPALFMNASERLNNLDYDKAIGKFSQLLALNETSLNQKAQAMFGKAAAYENLAQADKAAAIYDDVIKMNGMDSRNIASAKLFKQHLSRAPKAAIIKTGRFSSDVKNNGRIK